MIFLEFSNQQNGCRVIGYMMSQRTLENFIVSIVCEINFVGPSIQGISFMISQENKTFQVTPYHILFLIFSG